MVQIKMNWKYFLYKSPYEAAVVCLHTHKDIDGPLNFSIFAIQSKIFR